MQAIAVQYKNLIRWDVKSFLLPSWKWNESELVPLGSILKRRSEEYKGAETPTLLSIHFDGELTKRKTKNLKGRVFTAHPGDVVYSKIDVRNGAIGIVPETYGKVAFTSEFPIYEVDTTKINSLYLQLILKTSLFNKLINSLVSGSSGRKRVNPEGLEGLKIPMPSLAEQKKIFNTWKDSEKMANKLFEDAKGSEALANDYILSTLGVADVGPTIRKIFITRFKDFLRWDTSSIQKTRDIFTQAKYPVYKLSAIVEDIFQGVGKNEVSFSDIILLKVKNVLTNGNIDFTSVEYLKECPPRKILRDGDIIAPFIGEAVRLNKFAVFRGYERKCAADNNTGVIRIDQTRALPDFIRLCLASPIGRNQIEMIIIGGAVPFLGKTNAENLKIVLPPLAKQKEIVVKIEKMRAQATVMRYEAEKIRADAKARIEKLLVG